MFVELEKGDEGKTLGEIYFYVLDRLFEILKFVLNFPFLVNEHSDFGGHEVKLALVVSLVGVVVLDEVVPREVDSDLVV